MPDDLIIKDKPINSVLNQIDFIRKDINKIKTEVICIKADLSIIKDYINNKQETEKQGWIW